VSDGGRVNDCSVLIKARAWTNLILQHFAKFHNPMTPLLEEKNVAEKERKNKKKSWGRAVPSSG
jgi:hypothetical protein